MTALLDLQDLSVRYAARRSLLGGGAPRPAVDGVSLRIEPGRTFGLVGESGSGKSTIGRAILRLVDTSEGAIVFDGQDIADFGRRSPLSYRRAVQVVFQNPTTALNASWSIEDILLEPIRMHRKLPSSAEESRLVDQLLDQVGMSGYHRKRYPWELSGGQCQRIAIARALASQPRLIVCDEPVSALDVSTQSQVINLLEDLQEELGVAYLFIAHDLAVVRHISDEVGVMYSGRLLETGPAEEVYTAPAHPYTRMLLAAIPIPDPDAQRERRRLRRELRTAQKTVQNAAQQDVRPDAQEPAAPAADPRAEAGCPFQSRCPLVMPVCRTVMPPMRPTAGGGHVACHAHEPMTNGVPLDDR
ncbi:ATP-binding cassette domain-containing protein [Nocardioides sp. LMS-CY]|uniref:ABC-type oligopeptide transport system ATPase subunit n=1 Tax=Nocardioides soli TaxID=1036020 RepID=A0A7W4VUT1_9ACTN|nr:ATP-binding cassette domain-containing protein [Nocardioides sp. LMS-CY]MBB3041759.1 ABC-type oligopeptide transport system ATPase subunit [Nocardioides soli]QWF21280.1 ATP-binding cassette domain-containing protein [Nocardioides sp. LMS-CY]